jgi:hypothetical protein
LSGDCHNLAHLVLGWAATSLSREAFSVLRAPKLAGVIGKFLISFVGNGGWVGYPSPLPVCWDHRVSGRSRDNLWGSIAYGQNIEPQRLRSCRPIPAYTAFALARICFVDCRAQGRRSHGAMISVTSRLSKKWGTSCELHPSFRPKVSSSPNRSWLGSNPAPHFPPSRWEPPDLRRISPRDSPPGSTAGSHSKHSPRESPARLTAQSISPGSLLH